MNKEKADEDLIKTFRQREQKLIDTRYENLVRNNISTMDHISELENWARKGFSTSRSVRRKLNMTASPGLQKLANDALSPIVQKKASAQI